MAYYGTPFLTKHLWWLLLYILNSDMIENRPIPGSGKNFINHDKVECKIHEFITVKLKGNGLTITKLYRRYFSRELPRFWKVI